MEFLLQFWYYLYLNLVPVVWQQKENKYLLFQVPLLDIKGDCKNTVYLEENIRLILWINPEPFRVQLLLLS